MELINFLRVLYRKKWLIISVVSVAVFSTVLFTEQLPETFISWGKLYMGLSENVITLANEDEDEDSPQYVNMGPKFSALLDLLKSPANICLVSYELFLHDFETDAPFKDLSNVTSKYSEGDLRRSAHYFRAKLENMEPLAIEEDKFYLDLLKLLRYDPNTIKKSLKIDVDPLKNHLKLGYVSQNRFLSAFVVNALSRQFIRYYKKVNEQKSAEEIEFLTRLVEYKKQSLDRDIDEQVVKASEEQDILPPNSAVPLFTEYEELAIAQESENRKFNILQKLLAAIDAKMKASETAYLRDAYEEHEMVILLQKDELELLTDKQLDALIQRRPLGNILDSFFAIRNRIRLMLVNPENDAYNQLDNDAKERITHRIDIWLRLEETQIIQQYINQRIGRLRRQAPTLFSSLQNELSISSEKEEYLEVLTKLNRVRISSLNPGSPIYQIDKAQPSQTPVKEKNSTLVLLAGSVSFIVCILFVFFQEYLDVNLRSPYLFGKYSGLTNYGSLNMLDDQSLDLPRLFRNTQSDASLEAFKQNLRKIRFELLATGVKYFLFTSTQPKSGKSAIILSLAYSFSLNYKKVLIIDTNFKSPDLTQVCQARPNLEAYFEGKIKINQAISHSGLPNIDIIGSSGSHTDPEALFTSKEFTEFLFLAGRDYDYVFMEGPSMNQSAETKNLISHSEKILAIFSSRSSLKQADKASINYLKKMDQKVGTILNFLEINETS